MTPHQYLVEKTQMNPVQPKQSHALRTAYIAVSRKDNSGEVACYVAGVIVFALIAFVTDKSSSMVLAALGAIAIGVFYLGANRSAAIKFDRAARRLTMDELPTKVLTLALDRPQVEATLNYLLRSQDQRIYRFQISELYELERKNRIQAIQANL